MAKLIRPGANLLKLRITIYSIALAHLLIMSTKLLNIDFESSKDLRLHSYSKLKWRLITTWFNLLTLGYMPICLYCDWREMSGEGSRVHVKILNQFRTFCFSSLILPSTAFADITFWQLWNKDRELIMPVSGDEFISIWSQHSMHTASMVFVIFDLLCVHRTRPKSLIPGLIALGIFNSIYVLLCLDSFLKGEIIYPVLRTLSVLQVVCFGCLFSYCYFVLLHGTVVYNRSSSWTF
ncbi:androgen-dependent TFPI-regulating protein isoform 2 [Danaus plexippus plexippus]|uniref:Androgen-dependent TFPI-regulating protein isoform 2 n=1 Tax=Danaus plexippus plexippus TaxID=278856 RepID=A0A212EPN7_DANPL|nr:androgen-dependent TFPI-regulating protein isoform 2 [Danaus plexippus plexippus]